MKTIAVSVLALSAMTSVALAAEPNGSPRGPVELTESQMDGITAGQDNDVIDVSNVNVQAGVQVPVAANVCLATARCRAESEADTIRNVNAQFD